MCNLEMFVLTYKLYVYSPLQDVIEVDAETKEMLKMMEFASIPGLQTTTTRAGGYNNRN